MLADTWDFCYQIFPRKRKDIFRLVKSNDKKMGRIARRFRKKVHERMSQRNRSQDDGDERPDTPPQENN